MKLNPNIVFQEHIDRAQRNNDYEERWSNSEDETEIDPREVTIGTSFCIFRCPIISYENFDMSPEVYILLRKLILTSLGASNGDKTQRQLFHQLQQGHDEHERDIDKRRQGTFHDIISSICRF